MSWFYKFCQVFISFVKFLYCCNMVVLVALNAGEWCLIIVYRSYGLLAFQRIRIFEKRFIIHGENWVHGLWQWSRKSEWWPGIVHILRGCIRVPTPHGAHPRRYGVADNVRFLHEFWTVSQKSGWVGRQWCRTIDTRWENIISWHSERPEQPYTTHVKTSEN